MDKIIVCNKCENILRVDYCKDCETDDIRYVKQDFLKNHMNELLTIAIRISNDAHLGQVDKGGNPYILHPLAVMNLIKEDDYFFNIACKIVAILHDTVEDTDVTLEKLSYIFPKYIVHSIDIISKREFQSKNEYYRDVKDNPIARVVKLADLTHNMDISRIKNPTDRDYKRVEVYKERYNYLLK